MKLQSEVPPRHAPEDTHRGEALCLQGVWARLQSEVPSHQTPEDTHRGEALCLGSVGKASVGSQVSSHTRGHTQGRSPMFEGNVSES